MNTRPLPLALSAVALATAALWAPQALAHGGAAKMVPLKKAAKEANATVQWDSFAQLFTVSRNSTLVRVKPGASTAQVNGAPLRLADVGLRRSAARFAAAVSPGQAPRPGPDAPLETLIAAYDVHVGTPDDVIASLRADTALARVSDIVVQVHSIDPPHNAILRSIELTAAHVAPALGWRRADLQAPSSLPAVRAGLLQAA